MHDLNIVNKTRIPVDLQTFGKRKFKIGDHSQRKFNPVRFFDLKKRKTRYYFFFVSVCFVCGNALPSVAFKVAGRTGRKYEHPLGRVQVQDIQLINDHYKGYGRKKSLH